MSQAVPQGLGQLKSTFTPSKSRSPSSVPPTPSTPGCTDQTIVVTPTQRNLSSFAPWDRDQFVARLSTFKDVFWSRLPEEICELEWARRGWVQRKDGRRGVECGLCHSRLDVIWNWNELRESVLENPQLEEETKQNGAINDNTSNVLEHVRAASTDGGVIYSIESPEDKESTELLLKHYIPLLSAGHTTKCPWATRTTDITVLRLPPHLLSLSSFITRLQSLTPILPFLPPAERIIAPKPLPEDLPTDVSDYDHRAIQVSIIGWSGSLLGPRGILVCSTCHRRVGLWGFISEPMNLENALKIEEEPLDLCAEHKRYCPWINAAVQTKMAGWEYTMSFVEPKGNLKRMRGINDDSGKPIQLKRLREMLKGVKK
jgi:C3HC zinc finger-like/Rsm1-like